MDSVFEQKYIKLMQSNRRDELDCRIDVLDKNDTKVDEIVGKVLNGTVTISNSNIERRQLSLTLVERKKDRQFRIDEKSPLWINKRLRPYIGLKNIHDNGKIEWFDLGIFVITNPSVSISNKGKIVTVNAYDKMHLWRNKFMDTTKFKVNTPYHKAIEGLCDLMGETKRSIEETEFMIPYDRENTPDQEIKNELEEITNLYMRYQSYYDKNGVFTFSSTKCLETDPIYWTFNKNDTKGTINSININYDYDKIYNNVKVFGCLNDDTGIQPIYETKIEDDFKERFSINNIGLRNVVFNEDKYTNIDQCKQKAEYEIEQSKKFGLSITIQTIPIYCLNEVNVNIKVADDDYCYICAIDEITIPLTVNGIMQITCHTIAQYKLNAIRQIELRDIRKLTLKELRQMKLGNIKL